MSEYNNPLENTFNEMLARAIAKCTADEEKDITDYIELMTTQINPYMIFTETSFVQIVEMSMNKASVRDFVFRLHSYLFSAAKSINNTEINVSKLIDTAIAIVCVTNVAGTDNSRRSAVYPEIHDTFIKTSGIIERINIDPWLVGVIFLTVFVNGATTSRS